MELTLLSLDDTVLSRIIEELPSWTRRQLRCVNRRLRDLVDEQWTELRLGFHDDVNKSILDRCQGYTNVKTLKIYVLKANRVPQLMSVQWPALETLCWNHISDADDGFSDRSHEKVTVSNAYGSVRHLELTQRARPLREGSGVRHVGPETLRAIGSLFPALESLIIHPYETGKDDPGLPASLDFIVALAEPGAAPLARLSNLSLPSLPWPLEQVQESNAVNWSILEELELTRAGFSPELFGAHTHWPSLRVLNMSWAQCYLSDLDILFSAHMPNLEVVHLSGPEYYPDLGPGAGAAMTRCAVAWPRLRELHLSQVINDPQELEAFMSVPLPHLEAIDLNVPQCDFFDVLADNSHRWPSLKALTCGVEVNEEEALAFLRNVPWKLESLSLYGYVSDLGLLGTLPEAAQLRASLRTLHLETYAGEYESAPISLFQGSWPSLEDLKLGWFDFSVDAATALAACARDGRLPRLRKLDMISAQLQAGAVSTLCSSTYEELEELSLQIALVEDGDEIRFSQFVASFPKLSTFFTPDLSENELKDVLCAPWPTQLEKVIIRFGNDVEYILNTLEAINVPQWEPFYKDSRGVHYVAFLRPRY